MAALNGQGQPVKAHSAEGDWPQKDPAMALWAAAYKIAPRPPTRSVQPKGKLAARVFGWALVLGVFVAMRLLAVSIPSARSLFTAGDTLLIGVTTAQQLLGAVSLADAPGILAGSFAADPVAGLLIISVVALLFYQYTLPQVTFNDDRLHWRSVGIIGLMILPALFAITIAPFPVNAFILAAGGALTWAQQRVRTINHQLTRWQRLARRTLLLHTRDGELVDGPSALAPALLGRPANLRDLAEHLQKTASALQKRLWRKRDQAFNKGRYETLYYEARGTAILLKAELRALKRGVVPNSRTTRRHLQIDDKLLVVAHRVLREGVPLTLVLLVFFVALNPLPWLPPTCLSDGAQKSTIYLLSDSPITYLDQKTHTVRHLTGWGAKTLSAAECSSR